MMSKAKKLKLDNCSILLNVQGTSIFSPQIVMTNLCAVLTSKKAVCLGARL